MQKISDLISLNEQASLVKGVQLDWYGDPKQEKENERLASGYIFSSGRTARGAQSAIDIFEKIWTSLNQPGSFNVFTVIAKYGHGKSHFALVLANYFGRQSGDPVLEGILRQIEVCSDKNTAFHFRSFKDQAQKPQLVIRLAGHNFTDLRQGFLRALRRALDEHTATHNYPIKAISARAVEWLRTLTDKQRKQAQKYLDENYQTDLAAVIQDLEQFDLSKESIAREISRVVLGVEANFGADVNLRDIINQVIDDLCTGREAPFHKMVILFDELGIYSENWCHNRMAAGALAPQQILEACDDRRGRICLIAFLQREMSEFVKHYAAQEEFKKWAERFPVETYYYLETSLERVIKGLLIREEGSGQFARDFMPQIETACDAAWQILPFYQNKPEIWDQDKFRNIVGVGAFPLHPITTGLLCNLTFVQGGRTIIGFVSEVIRDLQEEPLSQRGELNWIFPIRLVDEFKNSFEGHEAQYSLYINAIKRLGANVPQSYYLVLKALFLFDAGKLKRYPSQSHASVLKHLCGLSETEIQDSLRKLADEHFVIRYSQAKKEYEFTGIGTSPIEIREHLQREVAGKTVSSLADKLDALKMLDQPGITDNLPISEANGFKAEHAIEGDEWQLAPRFMDAARLDADQIKRMLRDVSESARGLLVYAVSTDAMELENAQEQAVQILDSLMSGQNPYPVVITIPRSPAVHLEQEILMYEALEGWGKAKRELYGEGYEAAKKDSDRRLEDILKGHIKDVRYCVASIVKQRLKTGEETQLSRISDRLFEEAFPHRAPARSNILKTNSTKGNSAVAEVARHLLTNDIDFGKLDQATKNLVTAVLAEGKDKWGVLTSRFRLQIPTDDRVLKAWKELDEAIQANKPVYLESLSKRLRDVPYGYDDFTLTLLYAAWIGKNRNDLSFFGLLSRNSPRTPLSLNDIQDQLMRAKTFISWVRDGSLQIQRLGKGQEATKYLKRIEEATDYEKAKNLLGEAEAFTARFSFDEETRTKIAEAISKLTDEVAKIEEYLDQVQRYRQLAGKTDNVAPLLECIARLPQRPTTYLDFDDTPFVETKKFIEGKIQSGVEKHTQQRLKQIEDYKATCRDLELLSNALHKNGREDLRQQCIHALARINNEYALLKAQQEEERIAKEIDAIQVNDLVLASCREWITRIGVILAKDLANATDRTRQRIEKTQKRIGKRISDYEQWISDLSHRILAISNLKQAGTLRDEIIGREREYTNTPESDALQQYRLQVESKIDELGETERQLKERRVVISSHLNIAQDRAARVTQAQVFEDAARGFRGVLTLPPLPDGVEFTEEEEKQISGIVEKARSRVNSLFKKLSQPKVLKKVADFEERRAELLRAIDLLDEITNLPSEWRQELNELLKSVERGLENWQKEQERVREEQQRAEEEKHRKLHNSRIAEDTLKQTRIAHTLREIRNAVSNTLSALDKLKLPCDEQIALLNNEHKRLEEMNASMLRWVNNDLPSALSTTWVLKDIQELRREVVRYESLCGNDPLLSNALAEARTNLDRRSVLISRLASLEQQATNLSRCLESMAQLASLKEEHSDSSEQINAAENRLQKKLNDFRIIERRKAEEWLSQFQVVLNGDVSSSQASKLLRMLEERPRGLEAKDEAFLSSVREKLDYIRDTDIASKITDEFSKLQTSRQRAECLLRIAEICKAEGLPKDYADRLIQILEL